MPAYRWLFLVSLLGLSSCAGQPTSFAAPRGIECVRFARALTGIALSGDSPDWWEAAEGRFARTRVPQVGAILVFRRTPRLPYGHVSVVSRLLSPRQILVTHANWVHGRVEQDQQVADVSAAHDWSSVRVWWSPAGQLGGTVYPVYGFILPERRMSHDAIAAATPHAARLAANEGH